MPASNNATFNNFTGNVAYLPLTPVADATFNNFTGNVAYLPLAPLADATFNNFTGNVAYVQATPSADGTFNVMSNPLASAPPITGDGVMLYPISEDPNNRPILRY